MGARLSELLGLVWSDLDLADSDTAAVTFAFQVDRKGRRTELKTEASRRTVELPRALARLLLAHRAASRGSTPDALVFCSRTGRALGQRNVLRELRRAMTKAVDGRGRRVFPILSESDDDGRPVRVPRGAVPNFHGFRHTAASEAVAAGDPAEEVSWMLGHLNSTVTRVVYIREIRSAERRARRRATMETRYGAMLGSAVEAADGNEAATDGYKMSAEVVKLSQIRGA